MALACPNCKAPRTLADKVCARCRFHFEGGRVIELIPPRAGDGRHIVREPWHASLRRAWERVGERRWAFFAALGLVPGLGHIGSGARRRGLLFMLATLALFTTAAGLFGSTVGQIAFGLAVAVHAYSIFDLTPLRAAPDPRIRAIAVIAIQVMLLVVYWLLVGHLATSVQPGTIIVHGERLRVVNEIMAGMTASFLIALLFAVAVLIVLLRWKGTHDGSDDA